MKTLRAGILAVVAPLACAPTPAQALFGGHDRVAVEADVARPGQPPVVARRRRGGAAEWPIRSVYIIAFDATDTAPERRRALREQLARRLSRELGWTAAPTAEDADAVVTLSIEPAAPVDGHDACRVTGIVARLGAGPAPSHVFFTFVESDRPGVDAVTKFVDALIASASVAPVRRAIR
jgi:hypothetical protein